MFQKLAKFNDSKFKRNLILYLSPTVMILVFIAQVLSYEWNRTSSWFRGGFGMFSSIDRGESNRTIRLMFKSKSRLLLIPLPEALHPHTSDMLLNPNSKNFHVFGKKLQEYYQMDESQKYLRDYFKIELDEVDAFVLDVLRLKFAPDTGVIFLENVKSYEHPLSSAG